MMKVRTESEPSGARAGRFCLREMLHYARRIPHGVRGRLFALLLLGFMYATPVDFHI